MHILFFTENFPPEMNAAATRVYERACYWIKWGHEVTVVTCAPNFPAGKLFDGYRNAWYQTETMDGIRVVRVKTFISPNRGFFGRTLDFLSFMATGFGAGILQTRPDVVVSTSPQFFTAVAAWGVSFTRRLPYVFELGDLWPASIAALGAMDKGLPYHAMEAMELFLYRQSKAVVALTRSFKNDLIERNIPADKIAVVINGVDLHRYAPRARATDIAKRWDLDGKFVVAYIGTHGMAHGLENVLYAAEKLRDRDDIRLVMIGTGAMREPLMDEARRLNLTNVVFIPPQPKAAMPEYWSLCDVALIHLKNAPVFKTVIPSKMFEAMGMGLPLLLVAPEGEAKDIIDESGAGTWVPPDEPDALATAVAALADDHEKCRELATKSYTAAPSYSRERQARDMMAALESVVAGSSKAPIEVR